MNDINPSDMDGDRPGTEVESTVTDAIARLDDLEALPTSHHVEVFESVHEVLSQTLSAVDEA